jgi:hypothetical protein
VTKDGGGRGRGGEREKEGGGLLREEDGERRERWVMTVMAVGSGSMVWW